MIGYSKGGGSWKWQSVDEMVETKERVCIPSPNTLPSLINPRRAIGNTVKHVFNCTDAPVECGDNLDHHMHNQIISKCKV